MLGWRPTITSTRSSVRPWGTDTSQVVCSSLAKRSAREAEHLLGVANFSLQRTEREVPEVEILERRARIEANVAIRSRDLELRHSNAGCVQAGDPPEVGENERVDDRRDLGPARGLIEQGRVGSRLTLAGVDPRVKQLHPVGKESDIQRNVPLIELQDGGPIAQRSVESAGGEDEVV